MHNQITLYSPNESEIKEAYHRLPTTGCLEILISLPDLTWVLNALESNAFVGISTFPLDGLTRGVRITACKGNVGPCYDTGKSALYGGAALAALDDDQHLLFGETRICEKTANVYGLPVYRKSVKIVGGDSELITSIEKDPVQFDCNTFERDVDMLAKSIGPTLPVSESDPAVLYGGPFKMLILHDGTIVQRGHPLKIQDSIVSTLIETGEVYPIQGTLAELAETPLNLKEIYQDQGPLCLVSIAKVACDFDEFNAPDFTMLDEIPAQMRQRLTKLIDSNAEYFLMTGSDSRDLHGCCPTDGVTSANRLVEAGILQVARNGTTPGGCPVNIYAFAGEIRAKSDQPEFQINRPFRDQVKKYLQHTQTSGKGKWISTLRWSLLLFVFFSVGVIISNGIQGSGREIHSFSDKDLIENLDLPFQSGVVVLQFHRNQRCDFCNNMEAGTRQTLNAYFSDEVKTNQIAFHLVNMDLPEYENLTKRYQLFTSTIVLVELDAGESKRWKVFDDAWYLTDDRQEFMEKFRSALLSFRDGVE